MSLYFFADLEPAEEKKIRESIRAHVGNYIKPRIAEDDATSFFHKPLFHELAKSHFTQVNFTKESVSPLQQWIILEEIARVSPALAIVVGVTNLVQGGIAAFGLPPQRERFLKPLIKGEWLGAFSLSEPQSGSDAASLRLQATRMGSEYCLNGTKLWCSNAGAADLYLVMARTSADRYRGITSFLVSAHTPGFKVGKFEKKMGLKSSTLAELVFENCRVPADNRLGEEGQGFQVALSQLDAGRISIGVVGLGIAKACLEIGFNHLLSPQAFEGSPKEGTKQVLARFYSEICALEALLRDASRLKQLGKSISVIASQIKWLGSDLAVRLSQEALTLCAPDAYRVGHPLEQFFRDAKALQIVEGTNQIQSVVIAKHLEGEFESYER